MKIHVFTFNPFQENTYVVWDEQGNTLIIDPGCYTPNEEKLLSNFLMENGLRVTCVVNTHLHLDHVFGNTYVETLTGVRAQSHDGDLFWLKGFEAQCKMFGIDPKSKLPRVNPILKEGDRIRLGDEEFAVLAVPGHSPGGIALYNAARGCLFSGDSLFAGSIGRTDLAGGDYGTLINNIHEKIMSLPDATRIYPGHGPSTNIAIERVSNSYL